MIKPPGIIDNTIELPGRCYAIRMMPHEVDIADIHNKWDQAYADAMKLIVDENVDEGKEILEELYRRKYNRAGHTLSYGYGAGWFGEPDPKKYLYLVYALVLKGYSAAFSDYGFCYDCGIGVDGRYTGTGKRPTMMMRHRTFWDYVTKKVSVC